MTNYFYFSSLMLCSLIYIHICIKNHSFIKMPINIAYSFSFIILNVLGSYFVFFPNSSLLSNYPIYSYNNSSFHIFFAILFLQCISFIIFFPIHNYNFNSEKIFNESSLNIYSSFLFIISTSIIFLYFILNGLPPFFTTDFFNLSNDLIVSSRSDFFNEIEYFWFFRLGFYYMPQILCSILYINFLNDNKPKSRNIFIMYLVFASILSLSFLHKTPLVILFTQIFFTNILFKREINMRLIVFTSLIIFLGIYILYYLSFLGQLDVTFSFITTAIFQRLFAVYSLALSLIPDLVNHYGFYGGATSINPLGLFDFNQVNLSHELHLLIYGFIANAPAAGIGYAYSDFGFYGVSFFIIFVNILILFYQYLVDLINDSRIKIVFLGYIMTKALYLSISSIYDSLLNPTDIFLILIMLSIYYIASFLRGESRKI